VFLWRCKPIFCIFFRTTFHFLSPKKQRLIGLLEVYCKWLTNSTEHWWSETHTSEASDGQFNEVQQCNVLVRMLQVCISCYLKSVLRHKFLILDTYHPDTLLTWARMGGSVVILRTPKGYARKKFDKNCAKQYENIGVLLTDKTSPPLKGRKDSFWIQK
jgi:hypothetical protein